jgi:hypothetical protein
MNAMPEPVIKDEYTGELTTQRVRALLHLFRQRGGLLAETGEDEQNNN